MSSEMHEITRENPYECHSASALHPPIPLVEPEIEVGCGISLDRKENSAWINSGQSTCDGLHICRIKRATMVSLVFFTISK